ncbi:MAG: hypothetical protein KME07_01175 [Pegethrix bostrychoides GSE-TBD4-15B]|jgi:hypothetical protein|uniref:Uncharacterized protein n=1 Tax=Pegethrix bostrychoides GSE-TBD4-15B TaxID=2839662 RepID=A0A951P6U7_9CYAN|nr:hypothetical protein [Pegethrix bostrychoides GSE-TBD4-15B]
MSQTPPIAEAFLEQSWDDAGAAQAARDDRATQLQAAGYECSCADLWNVMGYRVYVVRAEPVVEAKRTIPTSGSGSGRDNNSRSSKPRRSDANKQRPARRRAATEIR